MTLDGEGGREGGQGFSGNVSIKRTDDAHTITQDPVCAHTLSQFLFEDGMSTSHTNICVEK